jgi:hypothetical protein
MTRPDFSRWYHDDAIVETLRDLLKVSVGPMTRLRDKRFKEVCNGFFQYTWAEMNFKKILNNEK